MAGNVYFDLTTTGALNTDISALAPSIGSALSAITASILLGSDNTAYSNTTGVAFYSCPATMGSADYVVSTLLTQKTVMNAQCLLYARNDVNGSNGYAAGYVQSGDSGHQWVIYSISAGSYGVPIAGGDFTFAAGATVRMAISVKGSTISLIVGTTTVCSVTNSDYAAAGKIGIRLFQFGTAGADGTGLHISYLRAEQYGQINMDSAAVHATPGNWAAAGIGSGSSLATIHGCARLCVAWTGPLGDVFNVKLDTSQIQPGTVAFLTYSLDGAAQSAPVAIPTGAPSASLTLPLLAGLASGAHQLEMISSYTGLSSDAWDVSGGDCPQDAIKILGFEVGGGAAAGTLTGICAARPLKGLAFTTSIGNGSTVPDPFQAYITHLGRMLNADIGVVGHPGQGWVHNAGGGSTTTAGVPKFPQTWDKMWAGLNRDFSSPYDFVLVEMGTNDPPNDCTAAVSAWLSSARAGGLASPVPIFVLTTFVAGHQESTVAAGVNAYLAANLSDTNVHLIDISTLYGAYTSTLLLNSDLLHPDALGHALLAGLLAARIYHTLNASAGGGSALLSGGNNVIEKTFSAGASSQKLEVFVPDSSVTTYIKGLTGLVFNTAGLTATIFRAGDKATHTLTLVAGTLGTYLDSSFKAIYGGAYELGVPDFAYNCAEFFLFLDGAANMAPVVYHFTRV